MVFLYDLFISFYVLVLRLAAFRNPKAEAWVKGRKELFKELEHKIVPQDRIIWMHCASAGELEQGKPVIEALKVQYPEHKILVSFFSPSGFSSGKKYPGIDILCYLPADTGANAKRFLDIIKPELVIFVKYEYWYHHLKEVSDRKIPSLLISSIFRTDQFFFTWYGSWFKKILYYFSHIFVQDRDSLELLRANEVMHASMAGDTRFDRVMSITQNFEPIPFIERSVRGKNCIIAGSTWLEDEVALKQAWQQISDSLLVLIIVPHELNQGHLKELKNIFPESVYYSAVHNADESHAPVIIMDTMGMLSRLYRYATLTYVGGGFNKSGIHNTLEAAVYAKPVFFGPHYQKFKEARDLVSRGGAFSFNTAEELEMKMGELLHDPQQLETSGKIAGRYVREHTGATADILHYIQANRLLTR